MKICTTVGVRVAGQKLFSRLCVLLVATALAVLGWPNPASATWAVVSVDPESKNVGVAFASCLNAEVLGEPEMPLIPMVFAPGQGAGIYTDTVDTSVEAEMIGLLGQGLSPEEVLNNVLASETESRARGQYAVVTVDGAAAAQSGSASGGSVARGPSFAVHGNDVAPGVVDSMRRVMEPANAADSTRLESPLAEVLVAALQAGSDAGGDLRCGAQTALFAQLVVVGKDSSAAKPDVILTVVVDDGDGQNPVEILASEYENGSSGLLDLGLASGRGVWIYLSAAILGILMLLGGFVVFRFGIGNTAARR